MLNAWSKGKNKPIGLYASVFIFLVNIFELLISDSIGFNFWGYYRDVFYYNLLLSLIIPIVSLIVHLCSNRVMYIKYIFFICFLNIMLSFIMTVFVHGYDSRKLRKMQIEQQILQKGK